MDTNDIEDGMRKRLFALADVKPGAVLATQINEGVAAQTARVSFYDSRIARSINPEGVVRMNFHWLETTQEIEEWLKACADAGAEVVRGEEVGDYKGAPYYVELDAGL